MWHSKWFKIGAVLLVIALFAGGMVMYRALKTEKNQVEKQAQDLLNQNGDFNNQSNDAQIAELKQAMLYLAKEVGTLQKNEQTITDTGAFDRVVSPNINGSLSGSAASADLLLRLSTLEKRLASLENSSGVAPASSSIPGATTTTTKKPPQYIPLGAAAELTDRTGITLPQFEITLDPADFPGYTGVNLEAVGRMSESSGTLSMNLYNVTDSVAVSNSDISTNSTSFILTTSFSFKLSSGRKTYRIWAKSSEGVISYIQSARLKVSY